MSETVDEFEKSGSDGLPAVTPTESCRKRVRRGSRHDRVERFTDTGKNGADLHRNAGRGRIPRIALRLGPSGASRSGRSPYAA